MENGFQLIKTRKLVDKVNIDSLEEKFKLKLPPLYKLFMNTFDTGNFKYQEYMLDGEMYYCAGTYYLPKGLGENNIGITSLYTLDEVFSNRIDLAGYGDSDIEKGLIRIADIGLGGGLFVGTTEKERDNIILNIWDKEPQYEKLSSNIFEFIQGLVLEPISEEELYGGVKFSQLYKNWGEDFWKVK